MATQSVKIQVSQSGAVSVKRDIADIAPAATSSATAVEKLNTAITHSSSAHEGLTTQAMAMQHALRSSLEQVAMGISPTQILAQQMNHLSYAMSGEGGIAAAAKSVGQTLLGLLSPVNLLVVGLFGLGIVGLQAVNWTNLFHQAGVYVITYLREFLSLLPVLSPYLVALGAALLVTFGPAALGAVYSLTIAIGGGLMGAISGLFLLLAANPFVVLVAGAAYAIVQMNGLQNTIEQIITTIGRVIEAVGRLKEAFGGIGDITAKGIQIQLDAKSAAAQLTNAFNNIKTKLDQSLARAKEYLIDGGSVAGKELTNGMVAGANGAAAVLKAGTAEYSQHVYELLNGVAPKLQGAMQTGADYTYNSITGAVERSIPTAGLRAGNSMQQAIVSGGNSAARAIGSAMASAGREATIQMNQAIQSAASAFSGRNSIDKGLGFIPGGSASGIGKANTHVERGANVPQAGSHYLGPNGEGSSHFVSSYQTGPQDGTSGITIANYTAPKDALTAIDTKQGGKTIVNVIKQNASEIKSILGIV